MPAHNLNTYPSHTKHMNINSTLNLFKAVPTSSATTGEPHLLSDYGLVISSNALYATDYIISWCKENKLVSAELNSSFHKSWGKVAYSPIEQLVLEQMLNYLTRYWLDLPVEYVYIPDEKLDLPALPITIIKAMPVDEIYDRTFALLSSGIALSQHTLDDIFAVLDDYKWTGEEVINNKEAQVRVADLTGILPKDPGTLFRYLYYKATGDTLVICNKQAWEKIAASSYRLPKLTAQQLIDLATSYNRFDRLWVLGFKRSHDSNRSIVNRISKLSKTRHVPVKAGLMVSLTSKPYDLSAVVEAARGSSVPTLVKAINSLLMYTADETARVYSIRNGKSWVKEAAKPMTEAKLVCSTLIVILQSRLLPNRIYLPEGVDYAIPTSEKAYLGNVPVGTAITLVPKAGKESLLVGAVWREQADLDLRAQSVSGSIGWNASYRNENLLYSGDMTSLSTMTGTAAEWLYTKQPTEQPYLVQTNLYYGSLSEFSLCVGYGPSSIDRDFMVDPADIVFSATIKCEPTKKENVIGIFAGSNFYVTNLQSGDSNVGRNSERTALLRRALVSKFTNCIRLRDIIPADQLLAAPEAGCVDLSELQKDTLMRLFVV